MSGTILYIVWLALSNINTKGKVTVSTKWQEWLAVSAKYQEIHAFSAKYHYRGVRLAVCAEYRGKQYAKKYLTQFKSDSKEELQAGSRKKS